jgi:hypothetical protein
VRCSALQSASDPVRSGAFSAQVVWLSRAESGFGWGVCFDWGDSVVAHPFASMGLGLGFVRNQVASGELERLRDGYLEVFSDLGPHRELVVTLELACRVGKVARALTWQRAIGALGWDEVDDDWARGPIESMDSLLDASYLGRT